MHVLLAHSYYSWPTNFYVFLFPNFRHHLQKIESKIRNYRTVPKIKLFYTTLPKIAEFQLQSDLAFGQNLSLLFGVSDSPSFNYIIDTCKRHRSVPDLDRLMQSLPTGAGRSKASFSANCVFFKGKTISAGFYTPNIYVKRNIEKLNKIELVRNEDSN